MKKEQKLKVTIEPAEGFEGEVIIAFEQIPGKGIYFRFLDDFIEYVGYPPEVLKKDMKITLTYKRTIDLEE